MTRAASCPSAPASTSGISHPPSSTLTDTTRRWSVPARPAPVGDGTILTPSASAPESVTARSTTSMRSTRGPTPKARTNGTPCGTSTGSGARASSRGSTRATPSSSRRRSARRGTGRTCASPRASTTSARWWTRYPMAARQGASLGLSANTSTVRCLARPRYRCALPEDAGPRQHRGGHPEQPPLRAPLSHARAPRARQP
mmetsp:Transcript_67100/g.212342  ORF Transcript_67100/g.212342 Transcript_67100/m.212342 type:complete len:200 (+) Transcript_67100:798-1397(+)